MAGYNRTRYVEELLERTESSQPSFTVHLHPEYWTLNNGSKFLYNNQIASLLDDIRAHRIPVDFLELFEAAKVPFYDGCLIVELLDYRPQRTKEPAPEKPERTRVVLHPNSETLWADICSLNQRYGAKWTDLDALEMEARLLLATAPPVCLDPDPHLTRIANHVLRVSTPTIPVSLKRKAAAMEPEEDGTDKVRRAKIMQFMSPRPNRMHAPSYRILDAIKNTRQSRAVKSQTPQLPGNQFMSNSQPPLAPSITPAQVLSQAHSPTDSEDKKKVKTRKKADTPQMQYTTPALIRPNGSQTPVPPQMTHQFINHPNLNNPSPSTSAQSPMQPQVYPNVQAATEATHTPVQQQQHYSQSPQPPSQPLPPAQPPVHSQNPQSPPTPVAAFQPTTPNQHFLHQPPAGTRNSVSKTSNTPQPLPQPPTTHQAQMIYAQQLQQGQQLQQQQANLILQQRLNQAQKNGRSTPQGAPSPARSSPMVSNQPLAVRSPMPPNAQPPPQQVSNSPQHPQHLTFTPQYNPGHLRPMVHPNPAQLPLSMASSHPASGNPGAQSAPESQMQQAHPPHPYPQMYGYPHINFPMQGRIPPGYWSVGMGRGIPGMVNGQPMAAIPPNAQQMPLGVGKIGPAGLQGR